MISRSKGAFCFNRCANPAQLTELAQRTEQLAIPPCVSEAWVMNPLPSAFPAAHTKNLIIASGSPMSTLAMLLRQSRASKPGEAVR